MSFYGKWETYKMVDETLTRTLKEWNNMIYTVLNLKEFSLSDIQCLLKQTYGILNEYHKRSFIPKKVAEIILTMDEFLYFASLMEEKEKTVDFYHFQGISSIVRALKEGFFGGRYQPAYPRLQIIGFSDERHILDLENDRLEDFFKR